MKQYYSPKLKVLRFEESDVVRTSNQGGGVQEPLFGENFGFDFL